MLSINTFASLVTPENPSQAADLEGVEGLGQIDSATESPFEAIWAQLELPTDEPLEEQDISALVELIEENGGELLPAMNPDETIALPKDLTGDDLLAFLMANAGTKKSELNGDGLFELESDELLNLTEENSVSETGSLALAPLPLSEPSVTHLEVTGLEGVELADGDLVEVDLVEINKFELASADENTAATDPEGVPASVEVGTVGVETELAQSEGILLKSEKNGLPSSEADKLTSELDENVEANLEQKTIGESPGVITDPVSGRVKVGEITNQAPPTKDIELALNTIRQQSSAKSEQAIALDNESDAEPLKLVPIVKSMQGESEVSSNLEGALKINQVSEKAAANTLELNAKTIELDPEKPSLANIELNAPRLQSGTKTLSDQVGNLMNEQMMRPIKLSEAGQALADRIQTLVAGDIKHAFIRLDPPELGALEIKIQVQHEQAQVQIVSQSAQVRDALEQQSARLREALFNQGMDLMNLDVSDQQAQTQHQQQSSGEQGFSEGREEGEVEQSLDVNAENIGLVDQYV